MEYQCDILAGNSAPQKTIVPVRPLRLSKLKRDLDILAGTPSDKNLPIDSIKQFFNGDHQLNRLRPIFNLVPM
jgi:hypothetical protein